MVTEDTDSSEQGKGGGGMSMIAPDGPAAVQKPTLRAALLRGFELAAAELGLNPVRLMAGVGLDRTAIRDPEARVAAVSACRLLQQAAEISGHGDFGLRVAMAQGFPDFGPLALLLREQPNVRSAMKALSDNLGMNTDVFELSVVGEDEPIIEQKFYLDANVDGRQMIELACARLVQIVRRLIHDRWHPVLVCFSHPAPLGKVRESSIFRCPIEYDCDFTGIVLRPGDLEHRVSGANEDLKRHAEAYVRTLKARSRLRFDRRVADVIIGQLGRGAISADRVAEEISITRRTLNRKLGLFGHSYSSILRIVREEKVAVLLEREGTRLSEISSELGFHHPSAFSTWFHENFACTPSEWRKEHRRPLAIRSSGKDGPPSDL